MNELGFGTHPEAPSSTVKDRGELEPYDSDRITEVDHERVEPEPSTRQFDTIPCPPAVWDDESFEPDR